MIKKKYIFLYRTTCLVNGKIYVGVHSTDKIDDGYIGCGISRQEDLGDKIWFHRAVRKYGYSNFRREVIEFFDNYGSALEREREIVNQRWVESDSNYNTSIGGGSVPTFGLSEIEEVKIRKKISDARRGKKASPETRQKMSETRKGVKKSEEHRKKIGLANKGKVRTDEQRRKNSEANKGRVQTEEQRRKNSEANKGKIRSKEVREKLRGHLVSQETREKIGNSNRGKVRSEEFKRQCSERSKGRKISEETRQNV